MKCMINTVPHLWQVDVQAPVSQNRLRRKFVVRSSQSCISSLHLRTLYDEIVLGNWAQFWKALPYFFDYKTEVFSFQSNPKTKDPSY